LAGVVEDLLGSATDGKIVARLGVAETMMANLGDSFSGFHEHARRVSAFKPLECNQLLLDRLKFILDRIRAGASHDRSTLGRLIEQSWIEVPCSRYPDCRGHRYDPHCQHRKEV
jgi:hypothetical protein